MSMDQNLQQKQEMLRPFNDMHVPGTESETSSDKEPVQCEAVPDKASEMVPDQAGEMVPDQAGEMVPSGEIVPDQAGEMVPLKSGELVPDQAGEIVTLKSGEIVPVKSGEVSTKSVQVKNRRSKTKGTIKNTKESDTGGASAAMADFKKFSKSLIKDFKVQTNKMMAKMKRDLKKLEAGNSTKRAAEKSTKRTRNKGKSTLKKERTQEHEKTPSALHLEQNRKSASSSNCIVPAVAANITASNNGRASSAPCVITRQGFDSIVQAPRTNFTQMGSRDIITIMYHGSIQTSVRSTELPPSLFPTLERQIVAGRGSVIPLPPSQGLGNTWNIGAATFPGSGLAFTSIGANTFPINVNSIGNVALIRMLESLRDNNR